MDSKGKHEKYTKIKKIGEGNYGKVYLVKGTNNGKERVMKEIDMSQMDPADQKAAFQEAKVMKMLNHPNIIKFHDVFKSKKQ